MVEPVADVKIGLKIWKYLGIAKDTWDQIVAAPQQIAALQARVTELETRLQRCPSEKCDHCGALPFGSKRRNDLEVHTPISVLLSTTISAKNADSGM
jgi:hypothetical protein